MKNDGLQGGKYLHTIWIFSADYMMDKHCTFKFLAVLKTIFLDTFIFELGSVFLC